MPFGIDQGSSLDDLRHGSYRAYVIAPDPHPMFDKYIANWFVNGEIYEVGAESDLIEGELKAQIEYSTLIMLLEERYGPIGYYDETNLSGELWTEMRLGLDSRMTIVSHDDEGRRAFEGLATIYVELIAEPGQRFRLRISYDLETSLTRSLSSTL